MKKQNETATIETTETAEAKTAPVIVSDLNAILRDVSITMDMEVSYNEDNKKAGKSHKQKVTFDYTGCTLRDALTFASAERRIAAQRGLRAIETEEQFVAFMTAGSEIRILAKDAGKKPKQAKTPEQVFAETAASVSNLSEEQKAQLRAMLG